MTLAYGTGTPNEDSSSARLLLNGTLQIDVSRIILLLKLAVACILALGILREFVVGAIGTETVLKDLRHFALDAERSLPAWYESINMITCAMLLCVIAALSVSLAPRNTRHWAILAAIFLLMSIDSSVSFHEVTVSPLRSAFHLSGVFYFSWVVLAAPLVVAVGLYFVPFLLRLPTRTALQFLLAGTIYVGGALGMEFVCGYLATTVGMDTLTYKAAAAIEEILEPIGLTLFLFALLRHISDVAPLLRLNLRTNAN
jgi:hypothetical protein